ncbi:hypothetical protein ALO75_200216 [Pseudomonas syringae pv. coryli]|uniref:Uncharacterized protein n=1 Tax=Pseudomonas syringae pv. coryli TaxID=317659 RepID=A0A0P9QQI6_9PSED|nr:hypothetical protein ALO75_200216 [Pseudomonas syringae pv. coryli]
MSRQHAFILARMCAGRDPDRTLRGLPLFTLLGGTLQKLRVDAQVELDRAGHRHALGTCAQITKALRLSFSLHCEPGHFREHRSRQPGKACVTPRRTLRQPGIGEHHGNPAQGTLMDVVGPQLGFHDDPQPWLHLIEKTRGRPRQVVGQVAMLNSRLAGKQRLDSLRTCGRHASHSDRQLRILHQQRANHRRGGDAFPH